MANFLKSIQYDADNPILAETPSELVSNKYAFIDTKKVIKLFHKKGWEPATVRITNSRTPSRIGFQRHMIRFRNEKVQFKVGDVIPELVYENSHDGSSKYKIHGGLFKVKCLNGLMVAETVFPTVSIRHSGSIYDMVDKANAFMLDSIPSLSNRIVEFKRVGMSESEDSAVFAWDALGLRYRENFDIINRIQVSELLEPVRKEDAKPTLWNVFNTVQERLMNGLFHIDSAVRMGETNRARPIKNIKEIIRINTGLWELAEFIRLRKLEGK